MSSPRTHTHAKRRQEHIQRSEPNRTFNKEPCGSKKKRKPLFSHSRKTHTKCCFAHTMIIQYYLAFHERQSSTYPVSHHTAQEDKTSNTAREAVTYSLLNHILCHLSREIIIIHSMYRIYMCDVNEKSKSLCKLNPHTRDMRFNLQFHFFFF